MSTSFWDHPIDKIEEALSIRKQITALQNKLSGLFGSDAASSKVARPSRGKRKGGKRSVSPESRAKMAGAQRARWGNKETVSASTASASSARKPVKRKGGMTPEGRARIAAATKARWAALRKASPGANLNGGSTASVRKQGKGSPGATGGQQGKRKISPEARQKMVEAAKRRWAKQKQGA